MLDNYFPPIKSPNAKLDGGGDRRNHTPYRVIRETLIGNSNDVTSIVMSFSTSSALQVEACVVEQNGVNNFSVMAVGCDNSPS